LSPARVLALDLHHAGCLLPDPAVDLDLGVLGRRCTGDVRREHRSGGCDGPQLEPRAGPLVADLPDPLPAGHRLHRRGMDAVRFRGGGPRAVGAGALVFRRVHDRRCGQHHRERAREPDFSDRRGLDLLRPQGAARGPRSVSDGAAAERAGGNALSISVAAGRVGAIAALVFTLLLLAAPEATAKAPAQSSYLDAVQLAYALIKDAIPSD